MPILVISYSRVDRRLVRAVVQMLALAMRGIEKAVFYDGDIEPGGLWFAELQANIDQAAQLFVFWCNRSFVSKEVRRELTYALEPRKRVVPVLLDNTPLADVLAPINGIDLRDVVQHSSERRPTPAPVSAPQRTWRTLAIKQTRRADPAQPHEAPGSGQPGGTAPRGSSTPSSSVATVSSRSAASAASSPWGSATG
jgi:hypothetical protein